MPENFADPGTKIVIILGWILVAIGVLKMLFWLFGEINPKAYAKIKAPLFKKFLTGNGNRLIFGAGGLITVILGGIAIWIAYFIRNLSGL